MLRFFATRLGWLLVTVFVVTFLVFCVNEFSPGQVARKILGPYATPEQLALLTQQMGLNRPVFLRYFGWLEQTLRGDLGYSTLYRT
jgi:peptide/nickel transport system permease protein